MKKLFLLSFILVSFSPSKIFADGNKELVRSAITGKIVDFVNQENLAGVEVTILETGAKTFSDFEGKYQFENVPLGQYTLKVNYISYKESEVKITMKNSSKKIKQTIFLESL